MNESMPPTLKSIADEAGVCQATVSYALKNSPKISSAVRERIRAIADRQGYRPNPQIATLMAHVRSRRVLESSEKVAVVWMEAREDARRSSYLARCWEGASGQATRLGYGLEEFWMQSQGMSPRRLQGIFAARGIRGVIFGPVTRIAHSHLSMNIGGLCAVTLGNALWKPRLHRSKFDHYHGMLVALHEVKKLGYRRPGLVLDPLLARRSDRRYAGAFGQLTNLSPADTAKAVLESPPSGDLQGALAKWLTAYRPDVILSGHAGSQAALENLGVAIPRDLGFVTLDWQPFQPETTGVDQLYEEIAANGVRLIVHQLQHNEAGVPTHPILMSTEGAWRQGTTTRCQDGRRTGKVACKKRSASRKIGA
jgi:DNA-binding LacI/PurR family transcriptional regulator